MSGAPREVESQTSTGGEVTIEIVNLKKEGSQPKNKMSARVFGKSREEFTESGRRPSAVAS